jgi:hypothetical protein
VPPALEAPSPERNSLTADREWVEGMRLRERVLREGEMALPSPSLAWFGPPPGSPSSRDMPELSGLRRGARP